MVEDAVNSLRLNSFHGPIGSPHDSSGKPGIAQQPGPANCRVRVSRQGRAPAFEWRAGGATVSGLINST